MENILVGKGPEKERFYLKELQEEGLLVREGCNRNGRWIVKK